MYCVWLLGRRIEKLGDSIVKKTKAPTLGMFNRFAAAILGAIIMYEIEHHMVMWAFAVGIMGGYFLIVVNLGYYSMKDEKELTKDKSLFLDGIEAPERNRSRQIFLAPYVVKLEDVSVSCMCENGFSLVRDDSTTGSETLHKIKVLLPIS